MIVGNVRANAHAWLEPDDGEVVTHDPAPTTPPAPTPESEPPSLLAAEPAFAPFCTASGLKQRSLLECLPSAAVQPPQAVAPGPAVAIAAPTQAQSTPTSAYVGERPVDPVWLAARETTLVALRADYEAARAKAQANGGTGPGWGAAVVVTDESGQTHSASGAPLLYIPDPNTAPVQVGWDEGGPVYQQPAGQWLEFNEEAFAASYRAQGGAPLQALAAQYGTDAATLLAQHPELWAVATHDHALNAGPAPAGKAMGNASQLGTLDLYLADPQIASLISAYGGTAAPATSGIAPEQVRLYGQARYEQLTRLGNAMQSVRTQYTTALAEGLRNGTGPGWVETAVPTYATDYNGQPVGDPTGTTTVRSFDPDAFTAWYVKQDGLQNKAFLDFYGASHTQYVSVSDESGSGKTVPGTTTFDNPNWSMSEVSGTGSYRMTHRELVGLDPNNPPDLNNDQAVGFDLEVGWATSQANIHQDTDWFDIAFKVVIVAAVSYFSAGTLGPEAASAMGMTATAGTAGSVTLASGLTLSAAGVVASAAIAGAVTSVVSGMVNDNLSFKSILQGALAGALTAGLTGPSTDLGKAAGSIGPVGTIALKTTVQGGIQALLGGSFKDGAIAGFASGLAAVAGASIGGGIDKAVKEGTMSAAEAIGARTLARVFTSAVKALGNPNDPNYGFASALVNDVVGQVMEPAPGAGATPPATTPAAPVAAPAPAAEAPPADEVAPPATAPAPAVPVPEPAPAPAAETPPVDEPALMPAPAAPGEPAAPEPAPIWIAANGRTVLGVPTPSPPTGTLQPIEGEQPAYPHEGLMPLPAGAAVTALVDEAGKRWFHIVAEGVDRIVPEVMEMPPVTVTGRRDALAQPSAEATAAMAAAAAGGRVLTGEELLALGSKAFGRALSGLGELVALWPELTLKAAGVGLYLLTFSSAAGGALEQVQISDDQRFVKSHDMPYGSLQRRDANGDWKTVVPNVQLMPMQLSDDQRFVTGPDNVHGNLQQRYENGDWRTIKADVQLVQLGNQRAALTDAEIRAINAPTINVPPPAPPSGPPPLTPPPNLADKPTPGYPAQAPAGPIVEIYPMGPPMTIDDLIIEQRSRDNNRAQADQRYRDNPSLQDPSQLAGSRVPGVGTWGYPDQPRTPGAGTDYQEQLQGVPYGLELNVGGQTDSAGNIKGGAWLDGSEVRDGQVWVIDRKDWSQSTADLISQPWNKNPEMLDEVKRQSDAVEGTGAKIEWQFSDQYVADKIRQVLKDAGIENINVVFVPKK